MNSGAQEKTVGPAPLVAPFVLLILRTNVSWVVIA